MEKKQTIFDDIKEIKGYILGVIAFATAVAAFLTQIVKFPMDTTLAGVTFASVYMIFVGFLINKSEQRQTAALKKQEEKSVERVEAYR